MSYYTGNIDVKQIFAGPTNTEFKVEDDGSITINGGSNQSGAKTLVVDSRDMKELNEETYSKSIQIGGDYNGSWRFLVSGGGGDPKESFLNIQVKIDGDWVSKWKIAQI